MGVLMELQNGFSVFPGKDNKVEDTHRLGSGVLGNELEYVLV